MVLEHELCLAQIVDASPFSVRWSMQLFVMIPLCS